MAHLGRQHSEMKSEVLANMAANCMDYPCKKLVQISELRCHLHDWRSLYELMIE